MKKQSTTNIETLSVLLAQKRKEYHSISEELTKIHKQIEKMKEEEDKNRKLTLADLLEVHDIARGVEHGTIRYKKCEEELKKLSKCFMTSCYFPDTNQRCIQIYTDYMHEKGMLKKLEKAIKKILPIIKVVNIDGTDVIRFSVLEPSCSQYGIYELIYIPQSDSWEYWFTRYGRKETIKKTDTMMEMLTYMEKKHKKEDCDEDDD